MQAKRDLRWAILRARDALSSQDIRRCSEAAGSRLFTLPEFGSAGTVMFFVSFGSEIETRPMIEQALKLGKRVVVPRAQPARRALTPCELRHPAEELIPGHYGILEPKPGCAVVPTEEIELVVVPGVAWGEDGYRVGYGGGYYDRFLRRCKQALRVGLAFEMQVVPEVPHGRSDLPVDLLVTEAVVRRFARPPRRGRERTA